MQIVIADVDANGRALPTSTSFALSGQVRAQGEGDDSLNRLATQAGCEHELLPSAVITAGLTTLCSLVLRNVWSYSK